MRWGLMGLGLLAIFLASWLSVPATNWSGWDEWLVLNLTSRGVLTLPYENRPFSLLFNLPGALLLPSTLAGFWLVHAFYLFLAGILTSWLAHHLRPAGDLRLPFMAGAFAVCFAPQDAMRLDAVLLSNYSGAAAAVLVVLVLLVVADRRSDPRIALLAGFVGLVALRALESTAALLGAAPLLLLAMPAKAGRLRRLVPYGLVVGVGLVLAARPLLPGQPSSYQVAGLGFDPHPGRLALRMAQLAFLHLSPLGQFVPAELLRPGVLVAAAAFLAVWSRLGRGGDGRDDGAGWWRLVCMGAAGAALALAVLALSPANLTPWRTQILSAPFVGLVLAGCLGGLAKWRPGSALAPVLAVWVVAVGTSRVLALQGDWDGASYWPRQSECLRQLAQAAPRLAPGTFLILLDEQRAWPATFTFRHAIEFLYEGEAKGLVWGAEAFLYPARFTPAGLLSEPYASIREAWRAPVALHRFDDLVVARLDGLGKLRIEPDWPASLPPLPEGAVYAPDRRIDRAGERPRAQQLLGLPL